MHAVSKRGQGTRCGRAATVDRIAAFAGADISAPLPPRALRFARAQRSAPALCTAHPASPPLPNSQRSDQVPVAAAGGRRASSQPWRRRRTSTRRPRRPASPPLCWSAAPSSTRRSRRRRGRPTATRRARSAVRGREGERDIEGGMGAGGAAWQRRGGHCRDRRRFRERRFFAVRGWLRLAAGAAARGLLLVSQQQCQHKQKSQTFRTKRNKKTQNSPAHADRARRLHAPADPRRRRRHARLGLVGGLGPAGVRSARRAGLLLHP